MIKLSHLNRSAIAISHDTFMAAASFLLALYIRLGDDMALLSRETVWLGTGVFTAVAVAVYLFMRPYRASWRYASMRDMANIVKCATLIVLVFAAAMFMATRLENIPRSAFFINWMVLLMLLGGPRFAYRALREHSLFPAAAGRGTVKIPVLLIGAEDSAEQFIRHMARDPRALYEAVAIIDNDDTHHGRTIHHVPVYGGAGVLEPVVRKLTRKGIRPQRIILTEEGASGQVRDLLARAEALGIPLARLPRLSEFKHGVSDQLEIQPIAVEDLLGRPQNVLDQSAMRRLIAGKKVLVTGAGGSIGGELVRQIAAFDPAQMILLELSEFALYQIQREIAGAFSALPLVPILCDVRNQAHVNSIFETLSPQIVFHAAAIKHVPLSESNIEEAILTNVFGTANIAEAAIAARTEAMLMISTDKAVNPTNVMGASKRLAESLCQALGESEKGEHKTKFITVRFGNVLGSAGSVVPLFEEQLAKGGPLTVTHPEMTRYFMTIREAVELVLQAAALGAAMQERKECIFVLDMGEPMRITDLAVQMIRLAGLKPDEDIKIVYTGLRPGEKLHEELFHASENVAKTSHQSIFLASPRACDIGTLRAQLKALRQAAETRDGFSALSQLKALVPEFNHQPVHAAFDEITDKKRASQKLKLI